MLISAVSNVLLFTSRLYKGLSSLSIGQLTLKSPRTMMFSGEIPFSTSVIASVGLGFKTNTIAE